MVLPGMRSTADMGTDGRPMNWRKGILLLSPRNNAPLTALTAAMREEETDDPQFHWWEEDVDIYPYQLSAGVLVGASTIVVDERATRLKAGDMLLNERTSEAIRVISVTNDTTFEATRGVSNTTPLAMNNDDELIYVGSAYREGAPRATGTSFNPTKVYNLTQIFREPIEWTRTAMKTRLRYTNDIQSEDRRRALNKHTIGMERAFWLGRQYETLEANQPIRFTGGVLSFIPASNIKTVVDAGGILDADELFSYFPEIFAYGSGEKLAFCSLKVLSILGEVVRKNSEYQWGPSEKEYGMNVKRLFTPAGTLTLTEHPLFGQSGQFLANSMVVMDTANLKYRYIDDTKLLKDREEKGVDGKAEEYLTECGLEVHYGKTFFWLKNILGAQTDTP